MHTFGNNGVLSEHDLQVLDTKVKEGLVNIKAHSKFPNIMIVNYTPECMISGTWCPITMACRGLIFDVITGKIIARPFTKFFNYSEVTSKIEAGHVCRYSMDEPIEATDKLDGSLGILWIDDDGMPNIATRGSFESEQSQHATALFRSKYMENFKCAAMNSGLFADVIHRKATLLFEIVYPENRIVVNYKGQDDIVFLAGIDNATGHDLHGDIAGAVAKSLGVPVRQVFPEIASMYDVEKIVHRPGTEGYVIRFIQSGTRIKIKSDEYIQLHRTVTQTRPSDILALFQLGWTLDDIINWLKGCPDEFYDAVLACATGFEEYVGCVLYEASVIIQEAILTLKTRKELALKMASTPPIVKALVFMAAPKENLDNIQSWKTPTRIQAFKLMDVPAGENISLFTTAYKGKALTTDENAE